MDRPHVQPAPGEITARPWLVLLVLCLGFFMILLDTTIVNVAIPAMSSALGASLDQVIWVINAYLLVYAVLLITAGRLGDIVGPRRLFSVGLIVFTIASAVCGLAQSPTELILARVAQGVGGALLSPQTLAMVMTIFPPQRRGAALGIWSGVAGLAAVAGPTIGGLLVTGGHFPLFGRDIVIDWRWIFYVNLPVGVIALLGSMFVVPDLRPGRRHRLDLVGVALASVALFCLTFGLIEGERYNWGAIWGALNIPEILVASVVFFAIFVGWERRLDEPLLPLKLFGNRNFIVASWITVLLAFGMLGLFLPFIILLQSVLGLSALAAGLTTAPMPFTAMLIAPFAGRAADRYGGKYLLMGGMTLFAAGLALTTLRAQISSTQLDFIPTLIVAGLGMGLIFAPVTTVAMRTIEPVLAGAASGFLNTARQIGGVMGSAIVGAVLQNQLVSALHDQARRRQADLPAQLPAPARAHLVSLVDSAGAGSLQVGRGQNGVAGQIPPGAPPGLAQEIAAWFHDVFVNAYITAMRPTMVVPIVFLFLGAASCLLIQRRRAAPAMQLAESATRSA